VSIPSVFVNYRTGELLRQLLEANEGGSKGTDVFMKITFDNEKTDRVKLNLYLQSSIFLATQTTATPTASLRTSASSTPRSRTTSTSP
jgi:hypothetical protein